MKTRNEEKMRTLVGDFEVKTVDRKARTFEGDLSTSHLDLGDYWQRDIVWPGAFKRTIDHFRSASDPYIPLLDSHDTYSIFSVFGHATELEERLTGEMLEYELADDDPGKADGPTLRVPEMVLRTKWQVIDGEDGDRVFDRLRPGSVRKMSMGYRPIEYDFATLASGETLRNLREVALREGSLVVFGMNPEAEVDLTTVKRLLSSFEAGKEVTDADRVELVRVYERLGALLAPASDPSSSPADDTDAEEEPKGLADDELDRIRGRVRKVLAGRLSTRISAVRRAAEPHLVS